MKNEKVDYIKLHLVLAGVKQKDIAVKLGITPQAVNAVVIGDRSTHRIQKAISEATGKSISELFPKKTKNPAPAVNNDEKMVETVGT